MPADAFWTGYRQTAVGPGELLVAIRIPLVPGRQVRFRKVGTRRALSIAKVLVAVAWRADEAGDSRPADRHLARRPRRPRLRGRAADPGPAHRGGPRGPRPVAGAGREAAATVEAEITPIDDIRSTADYRRTVTGRVLRRILLDG